ncbi:hypothetical protein [Deinococcus apachensis]|uniref:hypothetical protein n=1 Tax=Deinococcus apachensis TaxID=309886 RepID=UPI000360CE40|nr:hypothetical protein [Deinococcus apachensis]
MEFDFARAHCRFLKVDTLREPGDHPGPLPTRGVSPSGGAAAFFRDQQGVSPAYRSGPLFGHWEAGGERLQVVCAAMAGYIRWSDYDPGQPFAMHAEYVLGWTDALRAVVFPDLDWVGQWLAFPASVAGPREEARLLRQAHALRLVDRHRPLLVLGQGRSGLEVRASTLDAQDGERTLEVQEVTG